MGNSNPSNTCCGSSDSPAVPTPGCRWGVEKKSHRQPRSVKAYKSPRGLAPEPRCQRGNRTATERNQTRRKFGARLKRQPLLSQGPLPGARRMVRPGPRQNVTPGLSLVWRQILRISQTDRQNEILYEDHQCLAYCKMPDWRSALTETGAFEFGT